MDNNIFSLLLILVIFGGLSLLIFICYIIFICYKKIKYKKIENEDLFNILDNRI